MCLYIMYFTCTYVSACSRGTHDYIEFVYTWSICYTVCLEVCKSSIISLVKGFLEIKAFSRWKYGFCCVHKFGYMYVYTCMYFSSLLSLPPLSLLPPTLGIRPDITFRHRGGETNGDDETSWRRIYC